MVFSVAQLPLLQRFRSLAYLLVLLAIAGLCYTEANLTLFFLGTSAILFSWWLVERPGGIPLPRALINIGVLAASLGLFYELVLGDRQEFERHPSLLLALGHFMVAILICKLFERKSNRDYAQILTLSLLIMVAGAIIATSSLFFALLLGAYLALGLYAILLFHLRVETERALAADPSPLGSPLYVENSPAIRKDIRLVTAWSAILLLAVAGAAFLLFPRTSGQAFLTSLAGSAMSTGFSDHMRMNSFVHMHPSETQVMEVKLEEDGVNIGSELNQPYFRGMVLDTYDSFGKNWIRSQNAALSLEERLIPPNAPLSLVPPNHYGVLGMVTQTYTLLIPTDNALFAIAPPVSVASDDLRSVTFSPRQQLLSTRGPIAWPLHYSVRSPKIILPSLYDIGNEKKESPTVKRNDLGSYMIRGRRSGPISSTVPPEVSAIAENLVRDLLPQDAADLDPAMVPRIADRIERFLQTNYRYSLDFSSVNRSLDPTADFLKNRTSSRTSAGGNCEVFASAMVMMCRAVGANARVVEGYHGGEFNSIGGFYVVRQKDAHAWVEVYLPQRGWTIFDPSPMASDSSTAFAGARWLREIAQVLQQAWQQTVVAFDETSRKYLFREISAFVSALLNSLRSFCDILRSWVSLLFAPTTPLSARLLASAALTLATPLIAWLSRNWYRRHTSQLPRILRHVDRRIQKQLALDLLFFDDLLRLLGRTGQKKRADETPLEYIDKLSPALRSACPDARWLIGTFYDIRFGTLPVNSALREEISQALSRVRRELQHTVA